MRIGVAGALGRMGRVVADQAAARGFELALFGRPQSVGQSAGGRVLGSLAQALASCEVIVDFSSAAASAALARAAAAAGGPALVIGSTGAVAAEEAAIEEAAQIVPIVRSGNFSLAVALLAAAVEQTAARLASGSWDIDIVEAHHRAKRDVPSGTALMLADAAARGRRAASAQRGGDEGEGRSQPPAGPIGFSSLRAGDLVGEHKVLFVGAGEVVEFSHSARDRRIFADGALDAARWVRRRPAGLYGLADVLGLAAP